MKADAIDNVLGIHADGYKRDVAIKALEEEVVKIEPGGRIKEA